MDDTTLSIGDADESELVSILADVLKGRMSELEREYPFTSGGIDILSDKFLQPSSFDEPSLKYAEEAILAATFRMYWFNRSHFCFLEDKQKPNDLAEFANEDDYDDPNSEVKPPLFTDALAFKGKPDYYTDAILKEVWKSLCGKNAERIKDRQSLASKANFIAGAAGTKLATMYGMVPAAMIALVGGAMLFAAKIGLRTFCAVMSEKFKGEANQSKTES